MTDIQHADGQLCYKLCHLAINSDDLPPILEISSRAVGRRR